MDREDGNADVWASDDYIFRIDSSLWEDDVELTVGKSLKKNCTIRDLRRCWSSTAESGERFLTVEEVKLYLEWFMSSGGNSVHPGRYKPGSAPELYVNIMNAPSALRNNSYLMISQMPVLASSEAGSSSSTSGSGQSVSGKSTSGKAHEESARSIRIAAAAAAAVASSRGVRIASDDPNAPNAPLTPDEFILRELADIRRLLLQRFLIEGGMRGDNLMDPMLDLDTDTELFDILGALADEGGAPGEAPPHFPVGEWVFLECEVCLELRWLYKRACCGFPVCHECLKRYFGIKVNEGVVKIECCNPKCKKYVHRDEISARLEGAMKQKFYQFLVRANADPFVKTCPRCNHITSFPKPKNGGGGKTKIKNTKKYPERSRVVCAECNLTWCFCCHAPWHPGFTCRQFRKGDRLLKSWAHEMHHGQVNAQKCPKCQVYIQRTTGCDHMHCTRCKTDFCYRCGDRLRKLRFFGDHYSKLSIFGCKYRYKADKPVQRKLIRGAVFGSKLMVAPVLGTLGACATIIAVGFGVFILPVYGGVRLYQKFGAKRHQMHRFPLSQPVFRFGSDIPVLVEGHHIVPLNMNQPSEVQNRLELERL